ncbi:MAG: PdxA family dehydrogenase [Chloroflexota bacterium]
MATKPVLAIPLGDAAGVGPEVVARTLLDDSIRALCRPLVVGQTWAMLQGLTLAGGNVALHTIASPEEAAFAPGTIDVLTVGSLRAEQVVIGLVAEPTGRESGETLMAATRLVADGHAEGLVSAPVNKGALALAGFGHGHLEVVGEALHLAGPFHSLLAGPKLKVINMTGHCSVVDAIKQITPERIVETLEITNAWLRRWGTAHPRIAVCALNPHVGDGGVFGREEIEKITPGVAAARDKGIDARGPLPVDTLFVRALAGEFDAVLSMYHDQGFTPVKTVGLHDTASLGLGIPIPYATTDHGTGFDLAGKGIANAGSFKQALRVTVEMCHGAEQGR